MVNFFRKGTRKWGNVKNVQCLAILGLISHQTFNIFSIYRLLSKIQQTCLTFPAFRDPKVAKLGTCSVYKKGESTSEREREREKERDRERGKEREKERQREREREIESERERERERERYIYIYIYRKREKKTRGHADGVRGRQRGSKRE